MKIFIIIVALFITARCVYGNLAEECAVVESIYTQNNSNSECCGTAEGDRVRCDDNQEHIVKLYIRFANEIPEKLGELEYLEELYIEESYGLTGSIPDSIQNLSNLRTLELLETGISGSIPEWIGNLESLEILKLYYNKLSGEIPTQIGNLKNLKTLALNSNKLTGEIPDSIGQLENLQELHLGNNLLTGEIPESILNLENLQTFTFDNNCIDCGDIYQGKINQFQCYDKRTEGCPKSGIEIKSCNGVSECSNYEEANAFCYNYDSKQLYVINKSSNCYKSEPFKLKPGINIVKTELTGIEEADLTSISGNEENIVIYDCNEINCERTYGYIIDSSGNYYAINYDDQNTIGALDLQEVCNEIGALNKSGSLCTSNNSNDNAIAFENNKAYVINDNGVFGGNSGSNIVVKKKPNSITAITLSGTYHAKDTLNTFEKGVGKFIAVNQVPELIDLTGNDKCVRHNTEIKDKLESYCHDDCIYYDCSNGDCDTLSDVQKRTIPADIAKCLPSISRSSAATDESPSSYHCNKGYYILTTDDAIFTTSETNPENGKLYKCETDNGDSCTAITGENIPVGYFTNAHSGAQNNIVNYIQCDGTNCQAVFSPPSKESCDSSDAGDLILDGSLKICTIENGGEQPLSTTKKYLVAVLQGKGNVFSAQAVDGYYIIIEIDKFGGAFIEKKIIPYKKYRYTDNDFAIHDTGDENVCIQGSPIEYELYAAVGSDDSYYHYKNNGSVQYSP